LSSVEMGFKDLWRLSLDIRYFRREAKCCALSYRVSPAFGTLD